MGTEYITDEKEKLLKSQIYGAYLDLHDVSSSARRLVNYGKIFNFIFKWCRLYRYREQIEVDGIWVKLADEMIKEIGQVAERIKNKITAEPKDENVFFKELSVALKNAEFQYYRDRKLAGSLKISRKAKEIKKVLQWEEGKKGRPLTVDEQVQCISGNFFLSEEQAYKYIKGINREKIGGLEYMGEDSDDDSSVLGLDGTKHFDGSDVSHTPENEFFTNHYTEAVLNAVEKVLEEEIHPRENQPKAREIHRALFTLHCIKNVKNYEVLLPVFDAEIIAACKEGSITQKEIYRKFNQRSNKGSSAEVKASEMGDLFLEKLKAYLEKNNPEIILPK